MYENNVEIPNTELPDRIAQYFEHKIKSLLSMVDANKNIYNGQNNICVEQKFLWFNKRVHVNVEKKKQGIFWLKPTKIPDRQLGHFGGPPVTTLSSNLSTKEIRTYLGK